MPRTLSTWGFFLFSLLPVSPLWGQAVNSAEIAGVVSDSSGAAVPNATVKATQIETQLSRTTVSGVDGAYVLPNLPVGPYSLEVTAAGFATYLQKGILLSVGSSVSIPVTLPVGSVKQEVQVTANALMVKTHDTSVSQVIDSQRVLELPLNGRQATSLSRAPRRMPPPQAISSAPKLTAAPISPDPPPSPSPADRPTAPTS